MCTSFASMAPNIHNSPVDWLSWSSSRRLHLMSCANARTGNSQWERPYITYPDACLLVQVTVWGPVPYMKWVCTKSLNYWIHHGDIHTMNPSWLLRRSWAERYKRIQKNNPKKYWLKDKYLKFWSVSHMIMNLPKRPRPARNQPFPALKQELQSLFFWSLLRSTTKEYALMT